ncbi:methionyl-tRNA formyltransferase [Natrialbaceae archaeon A-CW1-1]
MDVVFLGANNAGFDIYEWLCDRAGVEVRAMVTERAQLDLVRSLEPDLVVAVGFRHIVPPEILSVPDQGCLNLHPGLLPETRGFNPNVWSIVEEHPAGVTLHYMDDGVDTGPIVARRQVPTDFSDTGKTLYDRLEAASIDLFTETWPRIEAGDITLTPQDDDNATTHQKADFVDLCALDPEAEYPVKELLDILRALTFPPFDNAYLELDGERYYIDVDITPESETQEETSVGRLSSY